MARYRMKTAIVSAALVAAALVAAPATAYAADIEQLTNAYTSALQGYETALDEQEQNAQEIASIEQQITQVETAINRSQGELDETAVQLYKERNRVEPLLDLIIGSANFHDAVVRYDLYERVERYAAERIEQLSGERAQLGEQRNELEARKHEIESRVEEARLAADEAEQALRKASHTDGAQYHQTQGNNANCGATSFIVAVNTLLHENRFPDNVEVWKSPSFGSDSTTDLVAKGRSWLVANGLADQIIMDYVTGDMQTTAQLAEELKQGHVIVMSSGPSSVWQRADGTETKSSAFPGGHYMMCYHYEDGVFYCNDSSVGPEKGAGVKYTEAQMQQWLDGRGFHFAVSMYLK